jgi:hypothetical protein
MAALECLPPVPVLAAPSSGPADLDSLSEAATSDAAPPPAAPENRTKDRIPLGFDVAASSGLEVGASPHVSGLISARTGLVWHSARLELSGTYLPPRTTSTAFGDVRVQLGTVSVAACLQLVGGSWEIPACTGIEAGAMRADLRSEAKSRTWHGPWLAPMARIGAYWRATPRVALFLTAELAMPVIRPRFDLSVSQGSGHLFQPSAASGRFHGGVETRFAWH